MITNPYLFHAGRDRAGVQLELSTPADLAGKIAGVGRDIAKVLQGAGFSCPSPEVVQDQAQLSNGWRTLRVLFPPSPPAMGSTVHVVDPAWQFVAVPYTETTAETFDNPGNRFYFDLHTGLWLTFTTQMLPTSISSPYVSHATYFEVPREDTI